MTNVPDGWRQVTVGDICEFKYGKSLPANKRTPGNHPVFGSNGVVGTHSAALTAGPTIVIGRKGSFGKVAYSPVPCWPIDTTYFVDSTATSADLRWLSLRLARLGLTELNRAAAVPGLNREDAYRKTLMLPPLEEQRRIADVLDRADELRAKRREALAYHDDLTQSIFTQLFGDGESSAIASGWERASLASLSRVITKGTTPTSLGHDFASMGIPFLRVQNLVRDMVDYEKCTIYISHKTHDDLARSKVYPGDILVSIAGTIGRSVIVPPEAPEMNCNQAVAIVRLRNPASREYIRAWLTSPAAHRQVTSTTVTATVSNLSLSQLGNLRLPVPPVELKAHFAERVNSVRRLQLASRKHMNELETLFASLQNRAFRGLL